MAKVNRTGLDGHESYLGFTFGGVHSSELQIVRVYDQRFSEQVLPQQSDKYIQLPNSDTTVYYGRNFGPLEVSVSFAYDDLSEAAKRKLKQTFASAKLQELTFDEEPYKTYLAKVSGQPMLNFVPFDDPEYGRVYRGEGEVTFFIPNPMAHSKYKDSKQYLGNNAEWDRAYQFKNDENKWILQGGHYSTTVYNYGDVEAPFKLYFNTDSIQGTSYTSIKLVNADISDKEPGSVMVLNFDRGNKPKSPVFCYDSELKLIYGVKEDLKTKTGEVGNYLIELGNFFNLPVGKSEVRIENAVDNNIQPIHKTTDDGEEAIEFKYWYY